MSSAQDPARRRREALRRGYAAERFVAQALVRNGWRVLAQNWRGAGGELDLVVEREGALRFVEVKARAVGDPGGGLDALTRAKRTRLIRAGEGWLQQHGEPTAEVCFLLALVETSAEGWSITWWDDPFDGR